MIPSIIQSTYKVYIECRNVLMREDLARPLEKLPHPPDLRDVAKIVSGCSSLPRESAENKKLFTRLWVHEALRHLYDRLHQGHEMDAVFDCIKACVRTIFRENFDSAFEHLGKIDGHVSSNSKTKMSRLSLNLQMVAFQVTQVNLRNLLFGKYLPDESGKFPFTEVQGFDNFDKVVQATIKADSSEDAGQPIINSFLPIRRVQF